VTADEALEAIRDILWPVDDPERSWTPDTTQEIADLMESIGRGSER